MHAKIIDLNDTEAYICLSDNTIVSIPITNIGNHSIGEFINYPTVFSSSYNKSIDYLY